MIEFNELSKMWLQYKSHTIKETSYVQYQSIINNHIDPIIGHMKTNDIDISNILDCIDLMKEFLSYKTLQDIVVVLKGIIKYGNTLKWCHIPIEAIPCIKTQKKEIKILDNYELKILEEYLLTEKSHKNIGLIICLYTGMRLGEICALTWQDIDFIKMSININKNIIRITKHGKSRTKVEVPKTEYSIRNVPMSYSLLRILKDIDYREGYVITGTSKYLDPRSYQYYFKKTLKKLDINDYNFHILRHTFATKCVECQMDIKSLSEILGHSSVNITLNTYVHSSFEMKKQEIQKFKLV